LALALSIAGTNNLGGLQDVLKVEAATTGFVTTDESGNKIGIRSGLSYIRYSDRSCYSVSYINSGTFLTGNFEWSYDYVDIQFGAPNGNPEPIRLKCAVNLKLTKALSQNDTNLTLPSSVKAKDIDGSLKEVPIIELGQNALANNTYITSVTIPSCYMVIGSNAFVGCTNLENVTYAEGSQLQQIGDYAFRNCTSLKKAYIPASLLSPLYANTSYSNNTLCKMGMAAYQGCTGITEIEITGANTIVIPQDLFSACINLSKVTIGDDVNKLIVCQSAFADTNIKELEFNCDIILGNYAFARIPNLNKVTFNKSISLASLTWWGRMFTGSFKNTNGGEVIFNNETVEIPSTMFIDTAGSDASHGLNKVSFGDKVSNITIGAYSFSNTGIEKLQFVGNTTIKTRGLAALGSYTKIVEFNGDETNIEAEAFSEFPISAIGHGGEPYISELETANIYVTSANNNTALQKITINTKRCSFNGHNQSVSGRFYGEDTFYGIGNQCTLTFGENVKELYGAVKNFTYNDVTRQGWGDIQKVYIQSPNTTISNTYFELDDNTGGNCTIYGYQKCKWR